MPIKLAVNFILYTIPTGIVSLVALSLGVYGIILVTRASLAQPKTRSWFGLSLMTVSIVINVIFFLLLQFFVLRFDMTLSLRLMNFALNIAPLVTLVLGMYGAKLVIVAASKEPKDRSFMGVALLAFSFVIEITSLLLQMYSRTFTP